MTDLNIDDIRKPAVAGTFYPGNAVELTKTIAELFSSVEKQTLESRPMALIAPHAGYPYSGRVAAKAYKLLEGEDFETVVVVSPSHTVFFKGAAVYNGGGYQTPLGVIETDQELATKIASVNPKMVYFSNQGHSTGSTRGEHALEVQLPFLQVALGRFKLVPIVMGDQEEDTINALGEALAAALKGTNALMVASTDLSHFYPEKKARKLDFNIQKMIERFDPDGLFETLSTGRGEACGGGPVTSVMYASRRLGAERVQFLDYNTSAAVTGDFEEVVGYLSAAIVAGEKAKTVRTVLGSPAAAKKEHALSDDDKQRLIGIAREAIEAKLRGEIYEPPQIEALEQEKGVFVTLKIDGQLRGCIGQIRARQPLYKAVAEMAVAAAFDDPRFPELGANEFGKLEYELSILSPLERVYEAGDIKVGRHGLMIKLDMHSGLLLPQVAVEAGWDARTFLEQTCLKAGLPKNSWKDRHAEIYRFRADIVS